MGHCSHGGGPAVGSIAAILLANSVAPAGEEEPHRLGGGRRPGEGLGKLSFEAMGGAAGSCGILK